MPLATYFSATKLVWLLENVKEVGRFSVDNCFVIQNTEYGNYLYAQVADAADAGELMFGTVDSWLVWNLTGGLQAGRCMGALIFLRL